MFGGVLLDDCMKDLTSTDALALEDDSAGGIFSSVVAHGALPDVKGLLQGVLNPKGVADLPNDEEEEEEAEDTSIIATTPAKTPAGGNQGPPEDGTKSIGIGIAP